MHRLLHLAVAFAVSSAAATQAQLHDLSLTHDNVERNYSLYVPENRNGLSALPLVVNMHGLGSNRDEQTFLAEMNAVAQREGFMVAYPDAINNNWQNGEDNVGFIGAMLDEIGSANNLDTSRVFATGLSQGGMMSYRLAAEMTNRIAAIAPVGGFFPSEVPDNSELNGPLFPVVPETSVPLMHIHGTADLVVPYNGGESLAPNLPGVIFPNMQDVLDSYSTVNECVGDPVSTDLANLNADDSSTITSISNTNCATYYGADGQQRTAEVLHYRVNDGGHTWPGNAGPWPPELGTVNRDIDSSQEMWNFFKQHQLRASYSKPSPVRGTMLMADSFDGTQLHPAWVPVDNNFQLGEDGQQDFTKPQPWGPAIFETGGQLTMRSTGSVPPIDPPIEDIDPLYFDWQNPVGQGLIWAPSTVDPAFSNGIFRTKVNVDGESAVGMFFRSGGPQGNYVFQASGARRAFEVSANETGQPGPGDDRTVLLNKIPDVPLVPGKDYWMQSHIQGDKLSLKVWEDGSPEPATPQLTFTDSQFTGGWIGLERTRIVDLLPGMSRSKLILTMCLLPFRMNLFSMTSMTANWMAGYSPTR